MRYMVEKNFVQVIGKIWIPNNVTCAYEYPLSKHDIDNIGEFTRENVYGWLSCHAGDFSIIEDFYATVGDSEIPWSSEKSEMIYNDCMRPADRGAIRR